MKDQYIYGINSVKEALDSGKSFEKVYFLKEKFGPRLADLKTQIQSSHIPFSVVPQIKFKGFAKKNHQGVIALISPIQYSSLDGILDEVFSSGKDPFFLATDSVTDIRNIGAIARSAQAFGVHALILPSKGGAMLNADAIKVSSGALLELPVCRVNSLPDTIDHLKNSGLRVISISEKSKNQLWRADLTGPVIMVLGSEGTGVSPRIQAMADEILSIPMSSGVGSLNVSVAAGIACSEVLRSRTQD